MGTFKQGDKIVVRLEGVYVEKHFDGSHKIHAEFETGNRDSFTNIFVSEDKIVEHELSEPTKPETVVKVDGRVFMLDDSRQKQYSRWVSSRGFRYHWEELKSMGDIEIIHEPESEDV